MLSYFERTEHM